MEDKLTGSKGMHPTGTSSTRRSSFVDLCQDASRRIESQKPGGKRRSASAPDRVSNSEESKCAGKIEPSHQDTLTADIPVAERSGRAGSLHEFDVPGVLSSGDGCRRTASAKGVGEKNGDDASGVFALRELALRELVQRQQEDLETAALIGQRLLDRVEELSASLEEVREEKWLAECEKDALRRDLDSATQRCEQMQQDTTIEALPPEEPQVEELDLWSPAAHAGTGARSSLSDDRPLSPVLENSSDAAEDAIRQEKDREEIGRLRRAVEGLEEANTSLREELTESRLEATALRRTSLTQREAELDRVIREAAGGGEEHRQARAGWGPADNRQEEDEAEGDRPPSMLFSSSSSGVQEEGAPSDDTCHAGEEDGPRPEEAGAGGPPGCRGRLESGGSVGGIHRRKQSIESTATSARSFRCRSSSMFRDAQEQAELIEALRGQIAQLRLEAKATTRAAGTGFRWNEEAAASHQHDGGAGQRRGVCSSDDDSGSDRGRDTSRGEDVIGEEVGSGREKIGSSDGDGRRADEHTVNPLVLRARVDERKAELEMTKRALEALRRRAQQEQAVSVELQRELLRLHGTRYNSGAVAAAVARVSAGTLRPASNGSNAAGRDSVGGGGGGNSNRRGSGSGGRGTGLECRIDCTRLEGMCWLHRLWRILFCGGCGETADSGVDTSFGDTGEVNDDDVGDDRKFPPGPSEGDQEPLLYIEERKVA